MRNIARIFFAATLGVTAAALAACGGGGSSGGGSLPPITGPSSAPSASPSPSAAPTTTPTPSASPAPSAMPDVRGVAVDDTTGAPIAGAVVIVSESTSIVGATPPPASASPWPSATTAHDGSFDVREVAPSSWDMNFRYVGAGYPDYPNAQWVEIFSPDGHAAYHGIWSIATTGTTDLGRVGIAMPSATDLAWLAGINHDRASVGTPAVTMPLAFDSLTLQTARYWATEMATYGFFAHQCPSSGAPTCIGFWLWAVEHHSLPDSQNIAYADPDWSAAEAQFMYEQTNCPGGDWQTCTYAENTGHYINIMSASDWAGVGYALGEDPSTQSGSSTPYYVENFTSPRPLSSVQSISRSLEIK